MRDWAKILKPWTDARKVEGRTLRNQVWREMQPLRMAMDRYAYMPEHLRGMPFDTDWPHPKQAKERMK